MFYNVSFYWLYLYPPKQQHLEDNHKSCVLCTCLHTHYFDTTILFEVRTFLHISLYFNTYLMLKHSLCNFRKCCKALEDEKNLWKEKLELICLFIPLILHSRLPLLIEKRATYFHLWNKWFVTSPIDGIAIILCL